LVKGLEKRNEEEGVLKGRMRRGWTKRSTILNKRQNSAPSLLQKREETETTNKENYPTG